MLKFLSEQENLTLNDPRDFGHRHLGLGEKNLLDSTWIYKKKNVVFE